MHFLFPLIALAAPVTIANPLGKSVLSRAVGDSCNAPEGTGTCQNTPDNCKGIIYPGLPDLCPNDVSDPICCVEIPCTVASGSGFCRGLSNGCYGTSYEAGPGFTPCPGANTIQCCVSPDTSQLPTQPPSQPPAQPPDVGQQILDKAMTMAGTLYAWGGGNCAGPSPDQPPYQYGDTGFDCSGLVCWALCQVTGRDLFTEGLRVTGNMYCANEATLKYKHYPFAERKAGDAVFFGGACDCNNQVTIHHVGLMIDSGDRMWNAPNDEINKVLEMSIATFGEAPCPDVIRFTA